jgi:hypothetical protein
LTGDELKDDDEAGFDDGHLLLRAGRGGMLPQRRASIARLPELPTACSGRGNKKRLRPNSAGAVLVRVR